MWQSGVNKEEEYENNLGYQVPYKFKSQNCVIAENELG